MTEEELAEAQELIGSVRWYIGSRWGDPTQQANAYEEATRLSDLLYGRPTDQSGGEPEEPESPEEPEAPLEITPPPVGAAKVALVVGHNRAAPGAWVKPPTNESEYVFNGKVADLLIAADTGDVVFKKFLRTPGGGYNAEIDRVYAEVNAWRPDLIVELHFNGGGGNYTCMLAAEVSSVSQECATIMSSVFADALGIVDKGCFARSAGERGGRSLYAGDAYTVLTEPFFGDNQDHADKVAQIGHTGVAYVYLVAINEVLSFLEW